MIRAQLDAIVELIGHGYAVLGSAGPLDVTHAPLVLRSPGGSRVVVDGQGNIVPDDEALAVNPGRHGGRVSRRALPIEDVHLWQDNAITTNELMADHGMSRMTVLRAIRRQLAPNDYQEAVALRQEVQSPAGTPLPTQMVEAYRRGASMSELAAWLQVSLTYIRNRLPP
jgi:hypothetical protein